MIREMRRLLDEVILLEHRLVRVAEALHADLDITVPGRAVLEFLERSGPSSVPDIARARDVSRQHIQTIVDSLAGGGLVERASNPAHRRSPLFALTPPGRAIIEQMHDRERKMISDRTAGISRADVVAATEVLAAVRLALHEEEPR
jgi:DNA-binding MarR family transcriptional regulator